MNATSLFRFTFFRTPLFAAVVIGGLDLSCSPAFGQVSVIYPTQGYMDGLKTREQMDLIDTNHDGKVSREEWIAYQERFFEALDKNKDGYLEPDEFFRTAQDNVIPFATLGYARGLMTETMFGKIDADHDGKLSKKEFIDYQLKIFDAMDTDKKQVLNIADFIVQKPYK
jgi:Ca2+-binding EF-hand superfamily protein